MNVAGQDSLVPIRELARRLGVTYRALRFYEDRNLLVSTIVRKSRRYDREQCRRAEEIVRFKRCGFTIRRIGRLLPSIDEGRSEAEIAASLRRQIHELEQRRREIERALEEYRQLSPSDIAEGVVRDGPAQSNSALTLAIPSS